MLGKSDREVIESVPLSAHDMQHVYAGSSHYELYVTCRSQAGEVWEAGLYLYGVFESDGEAYRHFYESVVGLSLFWDRVECTIKRIDRPTWQCNFTLQGEGWTREE